MTVNSSANLTPTATETGDIPLALIPNGAPSPARPGGSVGYNTDHSDEPNLTVGSRSLEESFTPLLSRDELRITTLMLEGIVEEVLEDSFICTVYDRTNTENPPERLEIGMNEVSLVDCELVVPGSLFSWVIGRTLKKRGQIINEGFSNIMFRRIKPWSDEELDRAEEIAESIVTEEHQ